MMENNGMSDIVERLNENIISDAFERRAVVDGALCERLIRERHEAADEIERLRERLAEADECNRRVSDENEKLRREAAIRIDALEREQEAHLKTMADLNKQAEMNGRLLTENASVRAENETLRRDVKNAIMGDSAELQDVKRENEKLRKALRPYADKYHWDIKHYDEVMSYGSLKAHDFYAAAKALGETDE